MQKILNICKIPKTPKDTALIWIHLLLLQVREAMDQVEDTIHTSLKWVQLFQNIDRIFFCFFRTCFAWPDLRLFQDLCCLTWPETFSGPVLPGLIRDFFRTCFAWPDLRGIIKAMEEEHGNVDNFISSLRQCRWPVPDWNFNFPISAALKIHTYFIVLF